MKKLLLSGIFVCFATVAWSDGLDAHYSPAQDVAIRRIFFETHSFLVFNEDFFMHDPDCGCDAKFGGLIKSRDGDTFFILERMRGSHYD